MNLNEISKYVINLPHRKDRLGSFVREIHNVFENKEFTLIDGLIKENARLGLWQAFKNCVQDGKDKNHPYIIIMEDDVVFREGACKYANDCLNSLPEEWDILLGGIYTAKELIEYNNYWNKVIDFSGGHFMIIPFKVFDRILNMEERFHIDLTFGKKENFNCYVPKKLFVIQSVGFSDKSNRNVDYSVLLNDFELL